MINNRQTLTTTSVVTHVLPRIIRVNNKTDCYSVNGKWRRENAAYLRRGAMGRVLPPRWCWTKFQLALSCCCHAAMRQGLTHDFNSSFLVQYSLPIQSSSCCPFKHLPPLSYFSWRPQVLDVDPKTHAAPLPSPLPIKSTHCICGPRHAPNSPPPTPPSSPSLSSRRPSHEPTLPASSLMALWITSTDVTSFRI